MKDNKNIERLFQEKFKDFEAIPPHNSWEIIADRLKEKKKKKRVIPFWFQFSGIAASLFIIGALIWNFSDNTKSTDFKNPENSTVNTNNKFDNSGIPLKNETVVSGRNTKKENSEAQKVNQTTQIQNENLNNLNIKSKKQRVVANQKSEKENKTNSNFKIIPSTKISKEKNWVANSEEKQKKSNNKRNNILKNQKENKYVFKNEVLVDNSGEKKKSEIIFKNKSFNETLISKNDEHTKKHNSISNKLEIKDSTLVAEISKETNPLEELLKEKESGKNADEKEKRSKWAISTNASPVYFNSLVQGSSIDDQFNANSKNYTTTLSYGIAGIYEINNKLSVKAGVNNINLSYSTNDVIFNAKMTTITNNIPTISRNAATQNIEFSSKLNQVETLSGDVENVMIENNVGALEQNISYIEVPLELSYKLIDKKFGIEVIGGMSTLFLNQNNISLLANGIQMEVGKANNLNSIHFSSNVGLGFRYSFWKSFNANFQPMFKYQINTFSENSSNFKPYFIGLYTGVSFSF
ncbi:hypothetical protein NAT47_03665 [Flavobacterium sp. HXWNR69]|uniref:Outer membrane protein beta-barrel domain-containing protein n=1 Tax=Flavobacterium fragile TaxID=2949085 RepID=A0ABT0TEV3_9FLAO|nr:hypothetical protein [Flavobacterium sp. HXWNR69]MCL9769506.1 hypothetical protein [Flavobacterium sp. HXWNR69]